MEKIYTMLMEKIYIMLIKNITEVFAVRMELQDYKLHGIYQKGGSLRSISNETNLAHSLKH